MNESQKYKTVMHQHLKQFTLEEDTIETMLFCAKKKYQHRRWIQRNLAIILPALLLLTGITTVGMPAYKQWRISVNQEKIPDLDPMRIVPISPSVQNRAEVERVFSSMDELEQFLGVHFLSSPLAKNSENLKIRYTGPTWNEIHIAPYITGDASFISYISSDEDSYTWIKGSLYKKPVDLTISFTSSPAQADVGMEYLGAYSFLEQYISAQGYPVNIIQEESAYESYIAVFVADGIKYELRTMTTLEELKNIVDSFY